MMRGFLIFQARYWLAVAAALWLFGTIKAAMAAQCSLPGSMMTTEMPTGECLRMHGLASGIVNVPSCVEQFRGLPALAKRLGVKPGHGEGTVMLHTCAHGDYSLFAIINAVLDRLDKPTLDANGTKVAR